MMLWTGRGGQHYLNLHNCFFLAVYGQRYNLRFINLVLRMCSQSSTGPEFTWSRVFGSQTNVGPSRFGLVSSSRKYLALQWLDVRYHH